MKNMNDRVKLSFIERIIRNKVQHFNYSKYFRWYYRVTNYHKSKGAFEKLICTILLYKIKKMDAKNGATLGAHLGYGAVFGNNIRLPHGIRGITITHGVRFGKNCTVFHYASVTGNGIDSDVPEIGDNVLIGMDAHIIGGVKIGNNVKIGAGCTVFRDIPDNTTVVCAEPRYFQN